MAAGKRLERIPAHPGRQAVNFFCLRSVKGNDIIKKNVKERGTWNGDEQREL